MILTVKSLLDTKPHPDRQEIKDYISHRNYCRCTGYDKIFQAVEEAGRILRGEPAQFAMSPDDAPLRKADGSLRYADDISLENLCYGKVLFSCESHAILKNLDISVAESIPGVTGIITADDIPGSRLIGMVDRDQPAMVDVGDTIRSAADPICAVFAESVQIAEEALKAPKPEYEKLPGISTIQEAMKPDAVKLWEKRPGNIFYNESLERGNACKALKSSRYSAEGQFSRSRIIHGYMEPESGLAMPDGKGGVEIRYPTQTVFDDQIQISEVLDIRKEKVRVIQLPIGGAFGGKEDIIFQHILAIASLKFNRPVKITLSRRESLRVAQKKHPAEYRVKLGMNEDGRFTALSAEILTDKGAYASLGFDIIENMMAFIGGSYFIPAVIVNGKSIHTNNVMSGAMRGFGANQSNFVIESIIDMLAEKAGMEPLDIRLLNALKPGLPTITNHILEPGVPGAREVLEAGRKALETERTPKVPEEMIAGFGIACGVKNVGFGHNLPESAGARIILSSDGTCRLFITHHEYGQGADIGNAHIVSEVLGIPVDRIEIQHPDTSLTPYTGATTASRQTFLSGNATLGACRNLISDLFIKAAERMGVADPASLTIENASVVDKNGSKKVYLYELGDYFSAEYRAFAPATEGFPKKRTKMTGAVPGFKSLRTHSAYAYGFQAAWIAVEPKTGRIQVLKILTVNDVGRTLNRRAVEGQMDGGVMMGIGYALSEQFQTERGRVISDNLEKCGLPRAAEVPEISNVIVEVPHPRGPLGVKGFAEAPSLATAPAISNAVYNAVGIRMYNLPMTPERVKDALDKS